MISTMFFLGLLVSFLFTVTLYAVYMIAISFTLWMAIDAAKQDRFWWIVLVVGVPIIGPIAYYFVEKKHEYKRAPVKHVHNSETEEQHEHAPKE